MSSSVSTIKPEIFTSTTPTIGNVFFSWYDYAFFGVMLCISMGIGIYVGCFGKKQTTAKDYLMGGNKMKVVPIVISLVASHCSGVTLLALPADIYRFGAAYWLGSFSFLVLTVVTIYVFLPVFHNLQLTSTYEYLGIRFDKRVRKCSSFLFAMTVFLHLPIVIYIPALAFSAASGINVHVITPIVCGVCIFYTTIGGLKALVWSDALQFSVTMGAMLTVFVLGLKSIGGISYVWQKGIEQGRLDIFDFDVDFTKRESFWAIMVGLTIHWIAHTSVNQGCTQKFLSVSSLKDSKKAVSLYCLGMILVKSLSVVSGLIMAAKYSECDPFLTSKIKKKDQLFPYYVLDVAGNIPGVSGAFIAGIFTASLSSLSANLNSLAGTIYEDFLKSFLTKRGKNNAGVTLKILVVIIGVISTSLVYIVEKMGGLLSLSIGLGSMAHGPLLGMFTLGLLFPRANGKGAFYGAMAAMLSMMSVIVGNNYYVSRKLLVYPTKPVSTDKCYENETFISDIHFLSTSDHNEDISPIFKISFYWYSAIGCTICVLVGIIISYMTEENDPPVSKELLSPVIHRWLSKDKYPDKIHLEYDSVEDSLKKVVNGNTNEKEEELNRKLLRLEVMRKKSFIMDSIDD
ncbi:unnamed protein product [Acanthoscelides obtectus]|uniref:Sodium-coupled monocarboxylate transporter 1 n=1 Tax=Acanthoscelides obtectus TaxID=200917 RepID=A0A9P0LR05_ACAOB|nr:unnamed protein product [Acanthoscelides obtectus]CAK1669520.1 Sodium-coupled monocarboxylate transporter 2 [Acanthoscelides obtectus]